MMEMTGGTANTVTRRLAPHVHSKNNDAPEVLFFIMNETLVLSDIAIRAAGVWATLRIECLPAEASGRGNGSAIRRIALQNAPIYLQRRCCRCEPGPH